MDKIIERSSLVYFTDLIWFCATLLAIYIGIKNFKKQTSFFLFQTYLFIALGMLIWLLGIKLFVPISKINKSVIQENFNIIFSFIEITAVLYFFGAGQNSKTNKKIIAAIWVISLLAAISAAALMNIGSTSSYNNQKYSLLISNLSFGISILLSLNYFYRLLTNRVRHIGPLTNSPSFWVTGGLFFIPSFRCLHCCYHRIFSSAIEIYTIFYSAYTTFQSQYFSYVSQKRSYAKRH